MRAFAKHTRRVTRATLCLWMVCVCLIASACDNGQARSLSPEEATTAPAELTFVPGDQVSVRVYGEKELGGDFQVEGDGSIDVPLIGLIPAEGKTQGELAAALEAAFADGYLKDPQVTVVVTARANREVSVLGAVNEPGRMPYVEKLTLVQAISAAGGLAPLAAPKKVKLTRVGSDGPQTQLISIKDITEGRAPDVLLRPGDIILVPESPI